MYKTIGCKQEHFIVPMINGVLYIIINGLAQEENVYIFIQCNSINYPVCLFTLAPVSLNIILSNTGDIQSKQIVQ